jgi:hypothetical protein
MLVRKMKDGSSERLWANEDRDRIGELTHPCTALGAVDSTWNEQP